MLLVLMTPLSIGRSKEGHVDSPPELSGFFPPVPHQSHQDCLGSGGERRPMVNIWIDWGQGHDAAFEYQGWG